MSRSGLLLSAGAALALLVGCGDAENTSPSPARPAAAAAADCATSAPLRVQARVGVGSGVGPLAIGDGTLWTARPSAGALVPVSLGRAPRAGARVAVGGAPVSVTTGLGGVYVADRNGNRILRVDPASGRVRVIARIDAPVKVVLADGRLYAISLDDGAIYSLNPRVAGLGPEVAIPLRAPVDAVRRGGDLWLLGGADHGVAPFRLQSGGFVRSNVQMPVPVVGAIAAGQGGVWVALPTDGSVVRIDPGNEALGAVHASRGMRPSAIAVDDCAVWVGDADGRVQRLDPVAGRALDRPIRIGRSLSTLVADRGGVWASDPRAGTVVRVAPRR